MEMWQVAGTTALLQTGQFAAAIDLRRPHQGLHDVRVSEVSLGEAHLLQLKLPSADPVEKLHESWIRGTDLVAVYAATERRPSQPEIYWRCLADSNAFGLELIASVHTGVLDDYPSIEVTSEIPALEAWWLPIPVRANSSDRVILGASPRSIREQEGNGLCVVHVSPNLSYLEMVFPSDFCQIELSHVTNRVRIHTSLFPERLEKGVIRRGRMRGYVVPRATALESAATLYQSFIQSDPPLTT